MKVSCIVSVIATSASLALAAPAPSPDGAPNMVAQMAGKSPVAGMAAAGQDLTASAFGAGDAILNVPGDFINSLMSGNVMGAFGKLMPGIMGSGGGLAKSVAKAGADVIPQAQAPKN